MNIATLSRYFLTHPSAICISIALSFFWALGWVPLFDLDEGAFTEATREMLASGIYSATYLDGEPRYDKPIFFYWLQAASITTFGFNEWAFRLPSVIMASLWVWAVFAFCREFIGRTRATIAGLFIANCLWVAFIARSAIADATLNLFLTLTLFDIWRYFHKQRQIIIYRVYLWMALGVLTKGPIAVAFPLAISILYLITSRAALKSYYAYINPIGWMIFIATLAPWVYAVYLEQGDGFFQGFIVEHNLKRFSDTRENHGGTVFYYILVLPLILLPFSGLLVQFFKNTSKIWSSPLERFLLLWFCVIFTLFSFSKTQLPHYILNACVPLLILFAKQPRIFNQQPLSVVAPILFAGLLVLLPLLTAIAADHTRGYDGAVVSRHNEAFTMSYTIASIICFVVVLTVGLMRKKLRTWQRLAVSGLVINIFVFTFLARVISELQEAPIHHAIAFLESRKQSRVELGLEPKEETVVAFRLHMPSFSVYRKKITPLREPTKGELVLTRIDRVEDLDKRIGDLQPKVIFQSGGIVIAEIIQDKQDILPLEKSHGAHSDN